MLENIVYVWCAFAIADIDKSVLLCENNCDKNKKNELYIPSFLWNLRAIVYCPWENVVSRRRLSFNAICVRIYNLA